MQWRVLTVSLWMAPPALAAATAPPAYLEAARANGVPPVMLYALALTESGRQLPVGRRPWPWSLNIAGRSVRYSTRSAACRALRAALEKTRLVDVGLSQLNIRWQRMLFGDGGRFDKPCRALNPYANLDAAAAILRDCYALHRIDNWIEAAGCYHRPAGGAPAARYRAAFREELARLRDKARVKAGATVQSAAPRPERLTWIDPQTLIRELAYNALP